MRSKRCLRSLASSSSVDSLQWRTVKPIPPPCLWISIYVAPNTISIKHQVTQQKKLQNPENVQAGTNLQASLRTRDIYHRSKPDVCGCPQNQAEHTCSSHLGDSRISRQRKPVEFAEWCPPQLSCRLGQLSLTHSQLWPPVCKEWNDTGLLRYLFLSWSRFEQLTVGAYNDELFGVLD